MTALTEIDASNTHVKVSSNVLVGDHDVVTGTQSQIAGDFNQLHGDTDVLFGNHNTVVGNNDFIFGFKGGILADPETHGGNFNTMKGNNDWISGNGNKLTGDNNIIGGDDNIIHDVAGGTIKIGGNNNFVFANHSDAISLIAGTGNELDFAGAKQGSSSVDKFVSGDEILVGKGQKTSLSSGAAGTTLHITSNHHEFDVLFSGADLATVKDSMHVVGNHVTLPKFNG